MAVVMKADLPKESPSKFTFLARLRGTAAAAMVPGVDPASEDARALATDPKDFAMIEPLEMIITVTIWMILYAAMAAYYHNYVLTEPAPEASAEELETREHYADFRRWKSDLFSCSEDWPICFWSVCCPGIRWADTMSEIGIHKYWSAFALFTSLYFIAMIPYATWLCWIISTSYCVYHRQEFRHKFGFEEQGGKSILTDFGTYCCCAWCAIAQEARMVKDACRVNHPVIAREEWKTTARSSARSEKEEAS